MILVLSTQPAVAGQPTAKGAGGQNFSALPTGPVAPEPDYQLGPFDKISVRVFGAEKLSVDKTQIDAGGQIVMPLIGSVTAGGKTAAELSADIAAKLEANYMQSPHVSVLIDEAVSQRVTVSGAVVESGIYSLKGRTTLNQAISMAKGPDTKVANLSHVAIFRQIGGKNARAVFDLKAIRAGQVPDPEVFGGDSIIVEGSTGKEFWHQLISTLPALSVFAYF